MSKEVAVRIFEFLFPDFDQAVYFDECKPQDVLRRLRFICDEWAVDDLDVDMLFAELAHEEEL